MMRRPTLPRPRRLHAVAPVRLAVLAVVLTGCTQGGLDPRGDEAARIFSVTSALVIAGTVVSLAVIALWWRGTVRGPSTDDDARVLTEDVDDSRLSRRFVVWGGIVMPAVVLAAFFGVQLATTAAQPDNDRGEFVLEVTGHRYWWELEYRGIDGVEDFTTANQVHVPVDTPVTVRLLSDDVIHSFWAPNLAGKVDLVPGRVNEFVLRADQRGVYPGYCAEYCGLQHTWMKFEVVAMEPESFATWAREQAAPASEPDTDLERRGREVFEGQSCVGCHTIRGVAEDSQVGPDLTHLATRTEIGAGILPLDEENLHAWVTNAQAIKPGAQMPPQELSREQLDALVAYLLSLE